MSGGLVVAEHAGLLRRALKNHDAICAGLRAGGMRSYKAIDDMMRVKAAAAALGCYPVAADVLRAGVIEVPAIAVELIADQQEEIERLRTVIASLVEESVTLVDRVDDALYENRWVEQ